MNKSVLGHVGLLALLVFLSACGPAVAPTRTPAPTPVPSPTSVPTLVQTADGIVYGDPGGRFTLPLVGDWTPVESHGSYPQFTLTDPACELYVLTVESEELEVVVDAALAQIGVDASALSLLFSGRVDVFVGWNAYLHSVCKSGQEGLVVS